MLKKERKKKEGIKYFCITHDISKMNFNASLMDYTVYMAYDSGLCRPNNVISLHTGASVLNTEKHWMFGY